jgi:AcrR family transcriptional regulator
LSKTGRNGRAGGGGGRGTGGRSEKDGAGGSGDRGQAAPKAAPKAAPRRKSSRRPRRAASRDLAQTGRKLGPRALRTRQRLLEATADLLRERSVLDISVVEIARKVETSPATFYHYFKDVEEAALFLAEQVAAEMPEVLSRLDGGWRGQKGLANARQLVHAFMDHWDAHHAVLLIRNLSADKGDRRFQRVRRMALEPLLDHLAEHIADAQRAGRVSPDLHPYAAAAAMASVLERLSAHQRELGNRGIDREEVAETCARVLYQVVTGSKGP